jgi:DNA-binding response OmpR family regulator
LRRFQVKSKILLVEDSRFLRVANERALARAGYDVITAGDGEEALRLAREAGPDLVLLDMLLPKVSGECVLRELKHDPQTQNTPVVVLSSLSQSNEGKLRDSGAAAYFSKSNLACGDEQQALVELVKSFWSLRRE